jgi:hypothetical protein
MEHEVNARPVFVIAARAHQRIGAAGLLGVGLLAAATVVFALAWRGHQRDSASTVAAPSPALIEPRLPTAQPRLPLPPASDIPLLLTRLQRAALEQGLGWPRADYRLSPAGDEAPASLEVHCTLKGPYPNVRRFVTALLQDAPTLTLREFALSRASADAVDVEAKLSIVVYLASGAKP